jgi:type I restriction-modification system DNA methylase subunit
MASKKRKPGAFQLNQVNGSGTGSLICRLKKAKGSGADGLGFCKSATLEEIKSHGYVLTPGRYVGTGEVEDDDEPFAEKMQRLTAKYSRKNKLFVFANQVLIFGNSSKKVFKLIFRGS